MTSSSQTLKNGYSFRVWVSLEATTSTQIGCAKWNVDQYVVLCSHCYLYAHYISNSWIEMFNGERGVLLYGEAPL